MGRLLRLKAPGLTYHITSRTHGKRHLLSKSKDKQALCKILNRILVKYGVLLYGFTPMNNHFHMIIRIENDADLSQVLCEFKTTFSKYFNNKYKLSGAFWGDRFRSTIIQDDKHALTCLRYIDRNPVKAGLTKHPGNWLLNSFQSYAYGKPHPILPLQPHPTYLALANTKEQRRYLYLNLVLEPDDDADKMHGKFHKQRFFGSDNFIQELSGRLN